MLIAEISNKEFFYYFIGMLFVVWLVSGMITSIVKKAQVERTRRDALAYVAEGSMTVEVAERLLRAAPDAEEDDDVEAKETAAQAAVQKAGAETRMRLDSHVAGGKIAVGDAERLWAATKPAQFDPWQECYELAEPRIIAEQTRYREVFDQVSAGKLAVDDALRLMR